MMPPATLARLLKERLPKIAPLVRLGAATGPKDTGLASTEAQELVDALDAAVGIIRDLTLAIGHESGCLKLKVQCSCGKATQLTAAHQQGAYIVRALRLMLGEKETP